MVETREAAAEPGSGKKLLFWLILLLIPVALLLAVETGVRVLWDDTAPEDAFLTFVGRPSFFEEVEVDGLPHYRVIHPEAYRARNTTFPLEKPAGSTRMQLKSRKS